MARITIEIDSKGAVKSIENVENALEKADRDVVKLEKDAKKTGNSLRKTFNKSLAGSIAGVFAGIGAGLLVRGLVRIADEMTSVNARIRTVTESQEEYNLAAEQLFQISQRTGTQLLSNATSFAKLNGAIKEIGGSTLETLGVVETLNKAFVINGSTAQEISSVMLQFAQAMGSGELRGEELRAVLEGNAFFARELAKALNTNIAGLRKMAEAGKLTTKVLLDAFPKIKETVDKTFLEIPVTVQRAMTEVENSVKRAVGLINEETQSSKALAAGIQEIARSIENNQEAISNFVIGIAKVTDAALRAFSFVSNSIGVFIGVSIDLFNRLAQRAEIVFFTIKTTAQTEIAIIGNSIATMVTNAIQLLNKLPKVNIELDNAIVQKLQSIQAPAENLAEGIRRINTEYQALREEISAQAEEYAKAAKVAITGNKETEKSAKKVGEEQQKVAKKVADTIIVFDKVSGTYRTISAAAVTSIAKQEKAWDSLGQGGQAAVKTIEDSLQRLTSKTYTVTIDVNENRTSTGSSSGGVSAGSSARTPSSSAAAPTGSSTAPTSNASNSTVDININNTSTGESALVTGTRQSVDALSRILGNRERFAS